MIALECDVRGVENVKANLLGLPRRLRERLIAAMTASVIEIGADARSRAPHGKTGRTGGGVRTEVREERSGIVGRVIDDWYVSRFVEGGVHAASMPVRSYIRRNRAADRQAIGKRGQTLKRLAVMGASAVKAYTRSVHIEARPFMRPAYEAHRSAVEARISEAVAQAAAETNG